MGASERPEFFSPAWWDAVAEAWNASGETSSMAKFGTARFRVTDAAVPPVWMHWDSEGRLTRRARGRADDPDFSASRANWLQFFEGRFTAGIGLLRLKLRFKGPVRRALPHTRGFNSFARVARALL
jgi:hypothetical protein